VRVEGRNRPASGRGLERQDLAVVGRGGARRCRSERQAQGRCSAMTLAGAGGGVSRSAPRESASLWSVMYRLPDLTPRMAHGSVVPIPVIRACGRE
jgi:hypothetical protein